MSTLFPTGVYILIAVQYLSAEARVPANIDFEAPLENVQIQSKLRNLRQCLSRKNVDLSLENHSALKDEQKTPDPNLNYLKHMLSKYLKESRYLEKRNVRDAEDKRKISDKSRKVKNNNKKISGELKFDDWTAWSACSVTCGKGRHIRWRHCRKNCEGVETEMEEKECQLPACPNKLFGLIKL